jgi:thiol-disulfide isomerase/thioredoxin
MKHVEGYVAMTSRTLVALTVVVVGFMSILLVYKRGSVYQVLYPGPEIGTQAPEFLLTNGNGSPVKLSHFKGKKVFLHFMASWCGDCRKELPKLQALYNRKKSDPNFIFLNVAFREKQIDTKHFFTTKGINLPIYGDPKGDTARNYGIIGIPASVIIDSKGIVQTKAIGAGNWAAIN